MKIFISYSNKDKGLRKIAADISQCLKNKGFETFFDQKDLNGYPNFDAKIEAEISESEGFIFLISPGSLNICTDLEKKIEGSYALTELNLARKKWDPPGDNVLPVKLIKEIICSEEIYSYLDFAGIFDPNGQHVASAVCRKAEERWLQQKNNKQPQSKIEVENYPYQQNQNKNDENPYRSLKHFGPNHAKYFFGRESFIDELIDRVYQANFITISGASGAGKSSVVLAGLVPKLHDELNSNWKFTYFKLLDDKDEPFKALAKALLPFCTGINHDDLSIKLKNRQALGEILVEIQCKNKLLIIADQFEEILTYKNSSNPESSEKDRSCFLHTLVEGIEYASKHTTAATDNRVVLITTIRDSSEVSNSNSFANHIGRVIDSLGPLDSDEFNNVVNGPLQALNGKFTDEVLAELKKEFVTNEQINKLPLLQYTLWYLWGKRTKNKNGDKVDLNSLGEYRGRIPKILGKIAEKAYDDWIKDNSNPEEGFKKLFLDLIDIRPKKDSRLQARSKTELGNSWALAEKLAESGLIRIDNINGDYKAEIAHVELIHYWKELEKWVEAAEKEAQVKKNLLDKANYWKKNNPRNYIYSFFYSLFNEDGSLLKGDELDEALAYKRDLTFSLSDIEEKFLNASSCHNKIVQHRLSVALLIFTALIALSWVAKWWGASDQLDIDTSNRLSLGEKYFFTQVHQEDSNKREGVWYFKNKEYNQAITVFKQHLNTTKDDPEARIYFNNARAKDSYIKPPIIAVIVPIQRNAILSKEILRGVAQAQNDVNEKWWGCIKEQEREVSDCKKENFYPFQVMIGSDDNDPETARRIANYMVERKTDQGRIIAVVGHNASNVTKSVIPLYQNHLVMISPTSSTLSAEDIGKRVKQKESNFTYLIAYPNKDLTPNFVEMLKNSKDNPKRKLLYCHDQDIKKDRLKEGFKDPITSVDTGCVFKGLKVDNVFIDAKKKGATDILLAPHANTITDSIFVVRKNACEKKKLNLYGTATLYSKEVLDAKEPGFLGMTLAISWHSKWKPKDDEETKSRIGQFTGSANGMWGYADDSVESVMNITWRTASAYDATNLISEGLNKLLLAETGLSPTVLQRTIASSLPFKGVTGNIEFDDNGIRSGKLPSILVRVEKNKESYEFKLLNDIEVKQPVNPDDYYKEVKCPTNEAPTHE